MHFTLFDLVVVESNGGDGVLIEGAIGDSLDECGLAGVLQSDNSDFELLAEEGALDPIQDLIEKAQHR